VYEIEVRRKLLQQRRSPSLYVRYDAINVNAWWILHETV